MAGVSGNPIKVGFFQDPQNPDCTQTGEHTVFRLTSNPQHGTVHILHEENFPKHNEKSIDYKRDTMRTPGVDVTYSPAPDYAGPDAISFDIFVPDGREMVVNASINISP